MLANEDKARHVVRDRLVLLNEHSCPLLDSSMIRVDVTNYLIDEASLLLESLNDNFNRR